MLQSATLGAALLAGLPLAAPASAQDQAGVAETGEIVVTATRRSQSTIDVPYGISAVGGDDLQRLGVSDIGSLSRQMPGLNFTDFGARYAAASVPIIRGINAGDVTTQPQVLAQPPVGVYIDNSPITGYLQLDDISRIEVLKGPQGTLYGAGSLGGSVRIIPNKPVLGEWRGNVSGGLRTIAHGNKVGYDLSAMLNIPLGDRVAFRASAKYSYAPGFIDVYGIVQRSGPILTGIPDMANPADPVNSSPILYSKKDWNYQRSFTGRAALLAELTDNFTATLAFTYAKVKGEGGPVDNTHFAGGAYPIDPRLSLPAGRKYVNFSGIEQPYERETALGSLDLSYDMGFATLSSTTSYYDNRGTSYDDYTYTVFAFFPFQNYYTGNPVNPRFVGVQQFIDTDKTFSQELRIVSEPGDDKPIDYVLGVFYQKQRRSSYWGLSEPGTFEYSIAQGCTSPYVFGAPFPQCISVKGPNAIGYQQQGRQVFEDRSVFGELTWHPSSTAQVTVGARYLDQKFTNSQSYDAFPFFVNLPPTETRLKSSNFIFKVNPSWEFAEKQNLYAIWSQGFRRGGTNPIVADGLLKESLDNQVYKPDRTNNFEVGIKGRLPGGFNYAVDAFLIKWDKPQITTVFPVTLLYAVVNGEKAESKGFEFQSDGPLFIPGLRYNASFVYSDSKLTKDFALPANDGTGTIIPGLLAGRKGQRLPGSPKTSGSLTLTYDTELSADLNMLFSLNGTYTGKVRNGLPQFRNPYDPVPSYTLFNASLSFDWKQWNLTVFANNFTDKRAVIGIPATLSADTVGQLVHNNTITQPRTLGMRVGYSF